MAVAVAVDARHTILSPKTHGERSPRNLIPKTANFIMRKPQISARKPTNFIIKFMRGPRLSFRKRRVASSNSCGGHKSHSENPTDCIIKCEPGTRFSARKPTNFIIKCTPGTRFAARKPRNFVIKCRRGTRFSARKATHFIIKCGPGTRFSAQKPTTCNKLLSKRQSKDKQLG